MAFATPASCSFERPFISGIDESVSCTMATSAAGPRGPVVGRRARRLGLALGLGGALLGGLHSLCFALLLLHHLRTYVPDFALCAIKRQLHRLQLCPGCRDQRLLLGNIRRSLARGIGSALGRWFAGGSARTQDGQAS